MLRFTGSRRNLCDGLTRRDLLHLGGLSALGLGLGNTPVQATVLKPPFGRARSCILLFLFGSPPQHETFDPKPDAPSDIQGELKAIPTNLAGMQIGEGLPRIAKIMDRLTVVRSLTHPFPLHGVPYALSGEPSVDPRDETKRDMTRWPFIGSVVDYVDAQRSGSTPPPVPRNIALPFPVYTHVNYPLLAGPYGGFLGSEYDPLYTAFNAKGTRRVAGQTDAQKGRGVPDPFAGIDPNSRLELQGAEATSAVSSSRFDLRRSLLRQFDQSRAALDSPVADAFTAQQGRALALLTGNRVGDALDLDRESLKVRERYGMTLFGQSALAARRLVEAGSRFVTVFWDAYEHFANGWDTHVYHYPRLKDYLLPGLDQTFSALILDLETRGMLDETLVICLSEHGRTPKLENVKGGGRGHWSRAYSAAFAGGGMGRGNVVGRTDAIGGDVESTPISPKDVLATAFYLLGIDPNTTVPDRFNRPLPITGDGVVRPELFG